jgi:nicotinate phosphoribosyltransferase
VGKITTPHFKKLYRLKDRETGMAEADLICVHDETVDDTKPLEIFDPVHTWKRKTMENFEAVELQKPIYLQGKQVYELPTLAHIREHCAQSLGEMWDEVRRFTNPHNYYVDLSDKLWNIKNDMIQERRHSKK